MKALLLGLAALVAAPAAAQTVAIEGGTVALGDGSQPIPNGTAVTVTDVLSPTSVRVARR